GPILNALSRADPFPRITGPEARVPAPTGRIVRDPDVRAAHDSVVRLLGTACGLAVQGSGWVASPGVVVTNAHVVAGESDTVVQDRGTGSHLDATPIAFDPTNDVAVLRVPNLPAPALQMASDPQPATAGAVEGFPHNGP